MPEDVVQVMRSLCLSMTANDIEPTLLKMKRIYSYAMNASMEFGVRPRKDLNAKPGKQVDLDFGENPKAYVFQMYEPFPGETKDLKYYARLIHWYAAVGQPQEILLSTSKIRLCVQVKNMSERFDGLIRNVNMTVERCDGSKTLITLADLPCLNFGDVISLCKLFTSNQDAHFTWIEIYLRD